MLRSLFGALKVIFSRETLDYRPQQADTGKRDSFLAWLLRPERLPPPAVSVPPDRTSFWRWLLAPEKIPPAEPPGDSVRTRNIFTLLFSRDTLPRDPEPPKRPRRQSMRGPKRGWGKRDNSSSER